MLTGAGVTDGDSCPALKRASSFMSESTRPMRAEAAGVGAYVSEVWGTKHPKLQILTLEELRTDAKIDAPPTKRDAGNKAA